MMYTLCIHCGRCTVGGELCLLSEVEYGGCLLVVLISLTVTSAVSVWLELGLAALPAVPPAASDALHNPHIALLVSYSEMLSKRRHFILRGCM